MSPRPFEAISLPAGTRRPPGERWSRERAGVRVESVFPTPEWILDVCRTLSDARDALLSRSVYDIARLLGGVGRRFAEEGDPVRSQALELLPETSGLSPAMARAVVDGMSRGWDESALRAILAADFPDPRALDGFVRRGGRSSTVVGPALAVQIVAGSVPGVGVDALLRSLLVKGPTLLKPGFGDVVLPVLYARALREADPEIADALAVVYWPGGNDEVESAAISAADVVTVYGADGTVERLRSRAPVSTRFVAYHHRVSVGVVGRDALESEGSCRAAATEVARSVALFDQRGCVCPQVVFVESGAACTSSEFSTELARALHAIEGDLPGGHLDEAETAALQQLRGTAELLAGGGRVRVTHGGSASWTVLHEEDEILEMPSGGRVARVRPVSSAEELPGMLHPLRHHLQTVGLTGMGARTESLARALGLIGAVRVAPFGAVPFPPPGWHHDGRGALADLTRWVDLESFGDRPDYSS